MKKISVKNKTCFVCKKIKNINEFHSNKNSNDGFRYSCKICTLTMNKKWKKDNYDINLISNRRWIKLNPDKIREYKRNHKARFKKRHPEIVSAWSAIYRAVRDGKIKSKPCVQCGGINNIHAHHPDYSKPLDIIWLCYYCHRKLHADARK